ncbi:MAG: MBL fold metallo-hydrolase [Pseudomonadota bacterium]|nr:MBL fold metallo-hydrolase [Pseudomonadota bacterium]
MSIIYESFPVGPLQCNCTILGDSISGQGYIFDPGGDPDIIMDRIETLNLKINALIHTHAHLDLILAAGHIHEKTGAKICLQRGDEFLWQMIEAQCEMFGVPYSPLPDPHHWLEHEEPLNCGSGICIHTPGHTPGSMSFYFQETNLLIAGDTLFLGSVGRTDFPGGNSKQLIKSIQERIYSLDETAKVITGHGPSTTIGHEMRKNAFVKAKN